MKHLLLLMLVACGPSAPRTPESAPALSVTTAPPRVVSDARGLPDAPEQVRDEDGPPGSFNAPATGTIENAELGFALRAKFPQIRACFAKASADAERSGTIAVTLSVAPDGSVASAACSSHDATADVCCAAVVKTLTFDPAPNAPTASYTFSIRLVVNPDVDGE